MKRNWLLTAGALGALFALTSPAWADEITQSSSVTISSPKSVPLTSPPLSISVPITQFNPADGTLDSIDVSFSGNVLWQDSTADAALEVSLSLSPPHFLIPDSAGTVASSGLFNTIDLSVIGDEALTPALLTAVTGTGTMDLTLNLNAIIPPIAPPSPFETIETTDAEGLVGTLTYNYTPAVSAVPEPASSVLFGSALALFGLIGWRRRRA